MFHLNYTRILWTAILAAPVLIIAWIAGIDVFSRGTLPALVWSGFATACWRIYTKCKPFPGETLFYRILREELK